jgi:CubicO group peptidase (beta-lactamase class C family)
MSDDPLADAIDQVIADTSFSGVVRVDRPGRPTLERASGFADRRWSIPMTVDTRIGLASVAKGFTGLAVMALVESGILALDTRARELLRDDLPLIDDEVTIEQLLAHRSGIGDYLDEEAMGDISDYAMPVPVHRLATAESYLAVLDGFPQVSAPGEVFAYNNGGFVVLAILAERAAGVPYHDLIERHVMRPAGLSSTGFVRSDALPAGVAMGYLDTEGLRTNALHLPLLGVGDGGIYSTVGDASRFWTALFEGRIVTLDTVRMMTEPRSRFDEDGRRYGLAFWLDTEGPGVMLEGYDAGASARWFHDPTTRVTWTVISNTSEGAWGMVRAIRTVAAE